MDSALVLTRFDLDLANPGLNKNEVLTIWTGKAEISGAIPFGSFRKYSLWFKAMPFFCSFEPVQLICAYNVAGRSPASQIS